MPNSESDSATLSNESVHVGRTDSELRSLQVLRAAAAVLVVVAHASDQFPAVAALVPTSFGLGGVDIFFLISGFVMTYTTDLRPYTRGEFIWRRIQRIVPLYWTMTFVTAAVLWLMPRAMRDSVFNWGDLATSLGFFPHVNAGKPDSISPMLKLGWTLNYEMSFYVLFAILLPLRPLRRTALLLAIFALLTAAVGFGHVSSAPFAFWGEPIVFEFVAGCLIGGLERRGVLRRLQPGLTGLIPLLAGIALFIACADLPWHRLLVRGGPGALILLGAIALERAGAFRFNSRWALFLGDASYSIYLGHLFPVVGFRVLCEKLHISIASPLAGAGFMGLCLLAGIGGGIALYLFVERPLAAATRHIRRKWRLAVQPNGPAFAKG